MQNMRVTQYHLEKWPIYLFIYLLCKMIIVLEVQHTHKHTHKKKHHTQRVCVPPVCVMYEMHLNVSLLLLCVINCKVIENEVRRE